LKGSLQTLDVCELLLMVLYTLFTPGDCKLEFFNFLLLLLLLIFSLLLEERVRLVTRVLAQLEETTELTQFKSSVFTAALLLLLLLMSLLLLLLLLT
jgi:hypothetical protein